MRKIIGISTTVLLLTFFSCKKQYGKTATVVKDCSGTYLRLDGKDYQVCNDEKLSSFSEGATVKVTFKSIDNCTDQKAVCYLLHANEGWISVETIK